MSRRTRSTDRRVLLMGVIGVVLLIALGAAVLLLRPGMDGAPPGPRMTLDPAIAANMTRLPDATPLPPARIEAIDALAAQVRACPDYSEARQSQMMQHIEWLLDPSTIPVDLLVAFASNPPERLLYGMAAYTSIEWRQAGRPAQSCLIPIGRMLDVMLVEADGEPLGIYDN